MDIDQKNGGIYIHIPFCKQACHYCNFHFSTQQKLKMRMVNHLCQELVLRKNDLNQRIISTIYFGGGTPSLLNTSEIEQLLSTIFAHFNTALDIEITLEANPDDLTLDKLKAWRRLGINRLSIGVQSFQDQTLRYMNRAHTSHMAKQAIHWAREAQFDNLNIDLIYATPSTTLNDWAHDLSIACALLPEHISAYSLTIEPKTVFSHWQKKGEMLPLSDQEVAIHFSLLVQELEKHRYTHYEIANFCQTDKYAKHNTNYWKGVPYLGIGPSAHSYNGEERSWNISHNMQYLQAIGQNQLPLKYEKLTLANYVNEYIMTSLRTCWGCDLGWIRDHYGIPLFFSKNRGYLTKVIDQNLAYLQKEVLYLKNNGKLLADKIASDLFIDNHTQQQGGQEK